jgi:hypothetical protein
MNVNSKNDLVKYLNNRIDSLEEKIDYFSRLVYKYKRMLSDITKDGDSVTTV